MATACSGLSMPALAPVIIASKVGGRRRRRITPEAGHALEILGHAIEYLSDEYVSEGGLFSAHDGRVVAIQLLMARNRDVYFACPEVPGLAERILLWLHRDEHLSVN